MAKGCRGAAAEGAELESKNILHLLMRSSQKIIGYHPKPHIDYSLTPRKTLPNNSGFFTRLWWAEAYFKSKWHLVNFSLWKLPWYPWSWFKKTHHLYVVLPTQLTCRRYSWSDSFHKNSHLVHNNVYLWPFRVKNSNIWENFPTGVHFLGRFKIVKSNSKFKIWLQTKVSK